MDLADSRDFRGFLLSKLIGIVDPGNILTILSS